MREAKDAATVKREMLQRIAVIIARAIAHRIARRMRRLVAGSNWNSALQSAAATVFGPSAAEEEALEQWQ